MLKLQLLLALILLGSGCSRQRTPELLLPVAPHANKMHDRDPRTFNVSIDAVQSLWLNNKPVALQELKDSLEQNPGNHSAPVSIRTERTLPFSTLQKLISACFTPSRQQNSFKVTIPPDDAIERDIFFRLYKPDDSPPQDMLTIQQKGDQLVLSNHPLDRQSFERILRKLAAYGKHQIIVIIPDPSKSVQAAVAIMDACLAEGLDNLYIAETAPWMPNPLLENLKRKEN